MARPRKQCVVYCADEERLSVVRYCLEKRLKVAVSPACTADELEAAWTYGVECVVLLRSWNGLLDAAAVARIDRLAPGFPYAQVLDVRPAGAEFVECRYATRRLIAGDMAHLADAVWMACARKRGPHKPVRAQEVGKASELRSVAA